MFAFFLAALLTQPAALPSASPSPAPALDPAWKKATLGKDEYAHYVRTEPDATQSELFGTRQVCDCQPLQMISIFQAVFSSQPGASVTTDTVTICGAPQARLTVTGIALPTNSLKNGEFIVFRKEPAMYMFQYTFRYAKPKADAEAALAALCP
jgi:hypothetical protein